MSENAGNLELNKGDQFIIAVDISGSMKATDTPSGLSRYDHCLEQLRVFVGEAQKWDPDGVSFYQFGSGVQVHADVKQDAIEGKLKDPKMQGATMTHLAVREAWAEHQRKGSAQTFLMIFTDGEPSDPGLLTSTLIDIAKQVKDKNEFKVAFLTVGQRSTELEQYLTSLDDGLTAAGAPYDIVDVKKVEDVDFLAAVEGALND